MKGSQGITTDVNICFISYEMIKTHMIKRNWWHSLKITFIKWIHISCLIYHVLEVALFWDVSSSFLCFLLIINRESHSVVFISTYKWEQITKSSLQTNQKQTYGYIWIWQKFTVWKGWLLLILSFLIFIF